MFDRTIFDTASVDIPLPGSNRSSTQIMADRSRAAELCSRFERMRISNEAPPIRAKCIHSQATCECHQIYTGILRIFDNPLHDCARVRLSNHKHKPRTSMLYISDRINFTLFWILYECLRAKYLISRMRMKLFKEALWLDYVLNIQFFVISKRICAWNKISFLIWYIKIDLQCIQADIILTQTKMTFLFKYIRVFTNCNQYTAVLVETIKNHYCLKYFRNYRHNY